MEAVGQNVAGELKECKRLLSVHARLHGSCSSNCSLTESDKTKQTNASLEHLAQTPNRYYSELSGEESKVEATIQQNKLDREEIPEKYLMPSGTEGVRPRASSLEISWSLMPGNDERGYGLLETQKYVSVEETSWVGIDQEKCDSLEPGQDTPEDFIEAYPSVDLQQKEELMNGGLRKTLDVSEQYTLLSELVLVQMFETSANSSAQQKPSIIDQHETLDVIERLNYNSKEGNNYSPLFLEEVSSLSTKHKDGGNEMTEIVPGIISSLEVSWNSGVRKKARSGLGAQNLTMRQVLLMMERLYSDHPGAVWRRASRDAMEAQEDSESVKYLVYGEISFIAFAKLVEKYAPHCTSPSSTCIGAETCSIRNEALSTFTFYDLGCGAGRPVFMASLLLTNCIKSCGIEILSSMHHMNKELLELYKVEMHKWLHPMKQKQDISFLCGNFLEADWSDADFVFTNATCFGDALFDKLEVRATEILKEGCIVITVTKTFKGDAWELLERRERRMSWASAMVSVYQKKQKWKNAP